MTPRSATERLNSADVLERHVRALLALDPSLQPVFERAGTFDVRLTQAGFGGLLRVVSGQQLSVASARAIWGRVAALPGAGTPEGFLALEEGVLRAAGFSAGKVRTGRVLAAAMAGGELDLAALEELPAADAIASLTRHKGVGRWTAEIYLMFCVGHPDIFPSGDLALQKAVAHALGLSGRLSVRELDALAERWAPYRHAAALLFWRYYATALRPTGGIAL
jgi:DNA-3-methyladenine glycosylase II